LEEQCHTDGGEDRTGAGQPYWQIVSRPCAQSLQRPSTTLVEEVLITLCSIPDDMQVANVRKALSAYLDRDLYAMFQIKLRENGGRVPALEPFMMARCVELKRCNPLVPWVPISSTVEDGQMVPR
jgi:hypothetical protein